MDINAHKNRNTEIIAKTSRHCQKITEALYRITELFPPKEPLKWILREDGMKIFKLFISLEESSLNKKINSLDNISAKINQLIYLLEIAAANSFITNINFSVLKREYSNLKDSIDINKSLYLPLNELSDLTPLSSENRLTEKKEFIGQSNGQNAVGESEKKMSIMSYTNEAEKSQIGLNNKEKNETKTQYNNAKNKVVTTERANKILDIVKSNEKDNAAVSIHDIFTHFKGISKKTIQRELANLVRGGILRAEGDKRWRRYILR